MTRNEVLDKLLSKYGKYGYTRLKISGLIQRWRETRILLHNDLQRFKNGVFQCNW